MSTALPAPSPGRFQAVDIVRGIAILGIFFLHARDFTSPAAYLVPTAWGMEGPLDMAAWAFVQVFMEGAFRGLFTLLFGVSSVLYLRAAASDPRRSPESWLRRRLLWLGVFGLIDMFIILQTGDVLFQYAICGFVLSFMLQWNRRVLVALCACALLVHTVLTTREFMILARDHAAAEHVLAAPDAATAEEREQTAAWAAHEKFWSPDRATLEKKIAIRNGSYAEIAHQRLEGWAGDTVEFLLTWGGPESGGMMLLGVLLWRAGLFKPGYSRRNLWLMTLGGYTVALAIRAPLVWMIASGHSPNLARDLYLGPLFDAGRIPLTLGHLGAALLWAQGGGAARLQGWLATTGRAAFSLYLLQNIVGMLVFSGVGLAIYGRVSHSGALALAIAAAVVQVALANAWLRRFRQGPAEGLLRWLTGRRERPAPGSPRL